MTRRELRAFREMAAVKGLLQPRPRQRWRYAVRALVRALGWNYADAFLFVYYADLHRQMDLFFSRVALRTAPDAGSSGSPPAVSPSPEPG